MAWLNLRLATNIIAVLTLSAKSHQSLGTSLMTRDATDAGPVKYSSMDISFGDGTKRKVYFRAKTTDEAVIKQIFGLKQYELGRLQRAAELKDFLSRQKSTGRSPLVVDAGANIGATSIAFAAMVPNSQIVAIEPDAGNFKLLQLNVNGWQVDTIQAALSSVRGHARVFDPGLGHWGYRTENLKGNAVLSTAVPCVTIDDIYQQYSQRSFPFIVKIDIEGGEAELFSANTKWVEKTPLLIIELHDWLLTKTASSRTFLQCISQLDRDFVYIGEEIFSIANNLKACEQ